MKKPVTTEELRGLLNYNPDTGVFTWRVRSGARACKGDTAGTVKDTGYVVITVKGVEYLAHRLAWWYVYGELPEGSIGRKNLDRGDNSIENLYLCKSNREYKNSKLRPNNSSGFTGVSAKSGGRWQARITVDGEDIFLGSFSDKQDAIKARKAANKKYGFGDFNGSE